MDLQVYLGHGASGSVATMEPFIAGLRGRGVAAAAVALPRRRAEDAVPAWLAAAPPGPGVVIGGHSYGGRVASLAAASVGESGLAAGEFALAARSTVATTLTTLTTLTTPTTAAGAAGYRALILFSYPLHPPGERDRAAARTSHWPSIHCPVLLLSGESDPFARIDLLRAAVPLLPDARLVTYPRLGHTLRPVLEDVLDRVAEFLHRLTAP